MDHAASFDVADLFVIAIVLPVNDATPRRRRPVLLERLSPILSGSLTFFSQTSELGPSRAFSHPPYRFPKHVLEIGESR